MAEALAWLRDWAQRLQQLPATTVDTTGRNSCRPRWPSCTNNCRQAWPLLPGRRIAAVPEQVRPVLREELEEALRPALPLSPPRPHRRPGSLAGTASCRI